MVYVNTLMVQRVLGEPIWLERMGVTEQRALTPLFWSHVNPYGTFQLDMTARLPSISPLQAPLRISCHSKASDRQHSAAYFAPGDTDVGSGPLCTRVGGCSANR
jgi:Tn3 transposase DDE domain